jgi:hypothetical protein
MSFSEEQKEKQPAPETTAPEASAPAAVPEKKVNMPKSTTPAKPGACAGCAKNLKKKLWHYRNGNYFCNNACFKKKLEDDAKKAAAAAEKAKAEAEKAKAAQA